MLWVEGGSAFKRKFLVQINACCIVQFFPRHNMIPCTIKFWKVPDIAYVICTIVVMLTGYKGGKFLKKLWCCVGGSITR